MKNCSYHEKIEKHTYCSEKKPVFRVCISAILVCVIVLLSVGCTATKNEEPTQVNIPQTIVQIDGYAQGPLDEYPHPTITFSSDGTCILDFNFYEAIFSFDATYKVYEGSDGMGVIKCETSFYTSEGWCIYDWTKRYFYLVEEPNGDWRYYGDTLGMTDPGCHFRALGEESILCTTKVPNNSTIKPGVYYSIDDNMSYIEVKESTSNLMFDFKLFVYGCFEFDNATAFCVDSNIEYIFAENIRKKQADIIEISGYLEQIDENNLRLVVIHADTPYVDEYNGMVFTYSGEEQQE